jgi:hypothetical protein
MKSEKIIEIGATIVVASTIFLAFTSEARADNVPEQCQSNYVAGENWNKNFDDRGRLKSPALDSSSPFGFGLLGYFQNIFDEAWYFIQADVKSCD